MAIVTVLKRIYNRLFVFFCNIAPVREGKIVFSSFNGQGFGDNPKYIALEILRQNLDMDIVWLVNNMDETFPSNIRKVKYGGRRMRYELSTAQFVINNVKIDLPYRKKKKQYYIQTWHGGFPFKYIEQEIEARLSTQYVIHSKRESLKIDLLLASCSVDREVMRNSFWYNGEIFTRGTPRNDIYFKGNEGVKKKVRDFFHIPASSKIVMYAPTFRNNNNVSAYRLDVVSVIECLEKYKGGKWIALIRLHPNVRGLSSEFRYASNIIDASSYSDSQELNITADCLVTDYSSLIYDFVLMRKPIYIYANDVEAYQSERGLRPIYFRMPLKINSTTNELIETIKASEAKNTQKSLDSFWEREVEVYDSGHASEAVVERIKDVMSGKFRK